jgi:ABC-type transport system involved in multi-copper enzyme maturation permease subunit
MDQAPHAAQHLNRHGRRRPSAGRPGRDRGRRIHRLGHDSGGGGGFGNGDPLSTVLTGADFAVLLVGVLGALAGAREYGSRMISATIAAVPRRWQVVVSKAVVLTGVLPTTLIGVLAAFRVGMGILSAGDGATMALADDGILRSVLGMAGYITAIALMGLGLGILLRSAATSIGVLIAGVMVLPTLAGALLPASLDSVLQYLPSSAAAAFTTVTGAGDSVLDATAGALVLVAWVAIALGASILAITRRDV